MANILKDDQKHAEQLRKIDAGKIDTGTTGQAMKRRPREFVSAVGADRITDGSPVDFYFYTTQTLSQRQADAGWKLMGLYRQGFPQPRLVGRIGEVGRELVSGEEEEMLASARRLFTELTDKLPVVAGRMISRIVRNEYPDCRMGVTHLMEGLDIVADRLKLPR
ncbi:hypothetical protein [Acetobacter aceti]|uniref:hypothetical protein n=1 Tax=Acetobacter aceti TaxID=435 RepID=UPI0011AF8771|nr:hypothetical protein [Acetobacter aceti]